MPMTVESICAVATPAGRGGVSIVRVSGPASHSLCTSIAGSCPAPGQSRLAAFHSRSGELIDQGLVLFFKGPHSFTGEDVCEFHTHGSPVITDLLLQELVACGARLAEPGEFSRRAFLNDKIDLAQAEAIADLISSASVTAAKFALRSLQGEFSRRVDTLVESLTLLRVYIEAALDFPEEEVDFLSEGAIDARLDQVLSELDATLAQARQGSLVREGIQVAIAGEPNAGKSTLLNRLSGEDAAIVTDIPGTTRDILRQTIHLDGLPVHLLDTAGLRDSTDPVELEGIRRARKAVDEADLILLLLDIRQLDSLPDQALWQELNSKPATAKRLLVVLNKCDSVGLPPGPLPVLGHEALVISALTDQGVDALRNELKRRAGFDTQDEGGFIARQRHLLALRSARAHVEQACSIMRSSRAGELIAEELRLAQEDLGEITGKVSSDALLGRIFGSFCIGK